MVNLIKANLLDGLLIGLGVSLVYNHATWPAAIVIVAIVGARAFEKHIESKEVVDASAELKDKISSIENKMALLGLSKRG
jgi:hypothetical protein